MAVIKLVLRPLRTDLPRGNYAVNAIRSAIFVTALALTGCSSMGFTVAPIQPTPVGTPQIPNVNTDYRTWGAWLFRSW